MQVQTFYKIVGVAFSLGSVVYFYFAFTSLDFAFPFFSGGMALGGLTFLIVGLSFLVGPALKANANEKLKQSGIPIETTYVSTDINWKISINSQHPYYIQTTGVDNVGQPRTFRSDNIWANPQSFLVPGQKVQVFIDSNNPQKYWVDISFLNKSV